MNPFDLLNPAVHLAHATLVHLATAIGPLAGSASVAVALVLITMIIRLAIVPLSIRMVRADRARRTLAPAIDRLRRKHSQDPARLLRETQSVHREAGISQFAGLGPALAQAPFLMVIYRLCTTVTIAGGPNLVLTSNLFGAPLAQHGLAIVASAGVLSAPALVFAVLITLMLAVAAWSASHAPRGIARLMPFGTVAVAMVVPLAVSLYVLTSTTWAVTERVILPHLV